MKILHTLAPWLLALLFAFTGPARAQYTLCPPAAKPPTEEQQALGQREARDRGMLWRATKDGRTSWLYGTIHVGRLAWTFPGPTVRDALGRSDTLALELDPQDPAVMAKMQRYMARDPKLTLTPSLDRRLRAQLQKACMPPALVDQMAPEMLGATLTVTAARREGFDALYGIDFSLGQVARALGKPVQSLETVETQLGELISDNEDDLRANVGQMLDDLEQGKVIPQLLRLARAWEAGRDDELANYTEWCRCADTPRDKARLRRLIEGRNAGLADSIDRLHAGGQSVFAAMGGLHLVGPEGLPALMARRGYTVIREPLPR